MAGKSTVEFYGTAELLQRLERAGKNVEQAVAKSLHDSVQKPKNEMLNFIGQHRETGITERSFSEEITTKNGVVSCEVGFSIKKGGLASLFLNLGTPFMKPYFFIDNAIDKNLDEIKRVQLQTLRQLLEE